MAAELKNKFAQLRGVPRFSREMRDGYIRDREKSEAADITTDGETPDHSDDDKSSSDLSDDEIAILKRQVETPDAAVGAWAVYRHATTADIWILSISCLLSIASGVTMPLMVIVLGNVQSTLEDYFHGVAGDGFSSQLNHVVLYFVYLAIATFELTYTYTVGFIYTGEHVTAKIRGVYLEHCLRQNIAFFDHAGTGEIVTRLTADTNMIQEAISQKAGRTLAGISTFVAAFIIAFITQWKLTLILVSILAMIVLNMGLGSRLMVKYSRLTMEAFAPAASLVEEVISSIRNTVAFGAQERLSFKLDTFLTNSEVYGFRSKVAMGLMMAGVAAIVNLGYALAFWVGGQYVVYDGLPVSKVLITAMVILMGAFSLGNVATNAQAIASGLAAAQKIYNTIDRQSPLDPFDTSGKELSEVQGSLKLCGVTHIFPSRPEVVVLDDVSLTVPCQKTTALVGASGSGKSTIIALVERFYEPLRGTISLDGHDISTLNLRWLRRQISLVSQEPTLFSTSVFNNIKHGLIGTEYEQQSHEVQRARIIAAAEKANAHQFISSLPEGYETVVGTRGGLLSGGQKQRIAIARAIVSDPKVLLLDEATSALDSKSEQVVQEALEAASVGRTTIVIAHRLSTIKEADNIVVMSKGGIVEQGTHNELLARQGAYYDLVMVQSTSDQATEAHAGVNDLSLTTSSERSLKHDVDEELVDELLNVPRDSTGVSTQRNEPTTPNRYSSWDMIKLIINFNRQEAALLIIGALFCMVSGGGVPVQCVLLAKALSTLSTPLDPSNLHRLKRESDTWAAMYVLLACVLALSYTTHGVLFARCSERLLHRARYAVFRSILRQDISFFDEAQNAAGGLTTFLSTKTSDIAGLSGVILGSLLISSTAVVTGLAVGITIGWRLGLVCASTVPALVACGYFQVYMGSLFERRSAQAYSKSAIYASEAVSAMPTLASLTREGEVLEQYRNMLDEQQRGSLRSVSKSSALFALSESLNLLILALCFWYGGTLIAKGEYSMFQYFVCFSSVIFSAQSAGVFFSHASNMSKAYTAAQELKDLFDRKPVIDTWSLLGEPIAGCEGHVEFRDVHFHYPGRPERPVLRGIDIKILPGQHVALVGPSGCGKSTSISLIERFYDPTRGSIFIDGKDISTLNVGQYRGLAALVSQEPTLYQGTIRENILLGVPDPETVPESQVINACHNANIYSFVSSLPDGFNTMLGSKGVLLSGGQKQRLAIARALIRDPRILLLDEATSALDSESEAAVQAALDKAAKGRTTITVAHRLSTIKKADIICVFDEGRIVERGTYGELILMNGHFAELVSLQNLDENS